MALKIIYLRDRILSFRERWDKQYPDENFKFADGTTVHEWRKKFDEIDWKNCSLYKAITTINRPESWLLECVECGKIKPRFLQISEDWDEGDSIIICPECLQKGVELLKEGEKTATNNVKKDLDYYMSLPYLIEIRQIPEEEGGGFYACCPELGRWAVRGYGDTIQEALNSLRVVKKERLRSYIQEGLDIPEPPKRED